MLSISLVYASYILCICFLYPFYILCICFLYGEDMVGLWWDMLIKVITFVSYDWITLTG